MPRPPFKRRKPNQSPARRAGKFDSQAAKAELDRKLANKPIGKRPQDSDDSDGLVTKASAARDRRLTSRQEIYGSGAVAKGDQPGAWPKRAQRTRSMRADTDEILRQRSRSLSRAASEVSNEAGGNLERARPKSGETADGNASVELHDTRPVKTVPPEKQVSRTPSHESSILGRIKPRKRQHSILRLIEDNESAIHTGDEEEFLPDEVSTPMEPASIPILHNALAVAPANTPESRKRKRGSDMITKQPQDPTTLRVESSVDSSRPDFSLPTPSRTQSKLLNQQKALEDEILALPKSSPESSPQKPKSPVMRRAAKQQNHFVPSTLQLQSLMPSIRHASTRPRRRQKDDFDIPEDSTSEPLRDEGLSQEEEEHSAFLPNRSSKSKSRKTHVGSNQKKSTGPQKKGQANKAANSNSKAKQSTKTSKPSTASTPSPKRLRKPLPLSSAKTRVQLQDKTNTTNTLTPAKGLTNGQKKLQADSSTNKAPSGGSRARSGRLTRARAAGKENDPAGPVHELVEERQENAVVQTIELDDDNPVTAGLSSDEVHLPPTSDMQAWQKKWADIDDYSLEFEVVTPASLDDSTRSSQRDMR